MDEKHATATDPSPAVLPAVGRWARNTRGGIALIFALAMVPIALAAGAAVDMGRAYVVCARLS